MADILIAEDDPDVRKWVAVALETEGHAVRTAPDGAAALAELGRERPDLLILDVMMPKISGFEVCRRVRAKDVALPILMLTARSREEDKLTGFGMGADDYVTKPFSMKELFVRVSALLRRAALHASAPASGESFGIGTARVDGSRMVLIHPSGEELPLAAREYELVRLLHAHAGKVLRRDYLLDSLWGVSFYGNTRTLDQHVALVRRKLGSEVSRLETIRNVGYRLNEDA